MSAFFLDSSALVKRYIVENGTPRVRAMTAISAGNRIFLAQITPVEFVSALARRVRENSISPRMMRAARLSFERHLSRQFLQIAFSDEVGRAAMSLLESHPLRAYDAIQLATAL